MILRRQLRPILFLSLLRAALGYAVAAPALVALGSSGIAQFPGGDALLFEPGGTFLVEALRTSAGALPGAVQPMLWLGVAALTLLLGGLCFVMVALADDRPPPLGEWARRSFDCLPSFALLLGLAYLAQVLALLVVGLLGSAGVALVDETSPKLRGLGWVVTGVVALALVLALGTLHDLARAARVTGVRDVRRALELALHVVLTRPGAVFVAYIGRALGSAAAVAAAAAIVGALHVEREGALRVVAVVLIHQAAALSWAALRASWLDRALAFVRFSRTPALDGIPADTAVPADPRPDPAA